MNATKLDTFTRAYIEAALWSSTGDNDEPLDAAYSLEDIAETALTQMQTDCIKFQHENSKHINGDTERAGHDFWLTRNRHGAGFWDGDWPEPAGRLLTDAAHAFGTSDLYKGDDGALYVSP